MSSDIPSPTPDPYVEDSWFQRPAFLATCALIVILVGTVLWFVSRESNGSADQTVASEAQAETSSSDGATSSSATGTSDSLIATSSTLAINPFGDVVGAPVTEPESAAGRFAVTLQQRGDPATVAALHSPAYYYALWSRLVGAPATAANPTATPTGYAVDATGSEVELIDLRPASGPIREGAEVRNGVTTPFETAIQSTAVCQPDREPQCDLSGANFAPDSKGSDGQMWALAKVVVDPAADTWLLYVDLHGPRLTAASAASSLSVGFDPMLNIVAVTYAKGPPPGTVLTLDVTADDGTVASFDFAVS